MTRQTFHGQPLCRSFRSARQGTDLGIDDTAGVNLLNTAPKESCSSCVPGATMPVMEYEHVASLVSHAWICKRPVEIDAVAVICRDYDV
jgi:hypothetical protein